MSEDANLDNVDRYVHDGEEVVMTGRTARRVVDPTSTQRQAVAPRRRPVTPAPAPQAAPELVLYEVKPADDTFSTKRWVTLSSLFIIDADGATVPLSE